MNDEKTVIEIRPSDLWRFRKDPVQWLQEEKRALVGRTRGEIRRAFPEPERWERLRDEERAKLCDAVFERLHKGSTKEFVVKLLGLDDEHTFEDLIRSTLEEERQKQARQNEAQELDPKELLEHARTILRVFSEKVSLERWNSFSRAEQDRQLAKLLGLIADAAGSKDLPKITESIGALDVLLHQEYQRMDTDPGMERNR